MPLRPSSRPPTRRRWTVLAAALCTAGALVLPQAPLAAATGAGPSSTTGAGPSDTTVVSPPDPVGMPDGIEGLDSYVAANTCDPAPKPGTLKLAKLLVATYPNTSYLTSRTCGTDPLATSEHYDGRAIDWMDSVRSPVGAAQASAVLDWLLKTDAAGHTYANLRRLGIMYLIWDNQIWGAYSPGWRPYSTCASHPESSWDTHCHRNHIHFSLSWEGARGATSYWSKQVAAPDYGPCRLPDLNWAAPTSTPNPVRCTSYPRFSAPVGSSSLAASLVTYSGMRLQEGSSGPPVSALQQAIGWTVSGGFGSGTRSALQKWQSAHGVSGSGVADVPTWRALLAAYAPRLRAGARFHEPGRRYVAGKPRLTPHR